MIYDGAEKHNLFYRRRMGEEIGPLHMGRVPGERPSMAEWRIYWWLSRIMSDHWRGALERARK